MATEAAARSNRPRPWLLIALAVVVGFFVLSKYWPRTPAPSPAGPQRSAARGPGNDKTIDPEDLTVRLEDLKAEHPTMGETERNPFRFQPRVEPAPPGPPKPMVPPPPPPETVTSQEPRIVPPPPIPLKFIGIVGATRVGKIAAFTDCRATFQGQEGGVIDGRYRLVRIGVQSVEMEYLDGRGRQVIRMSGQECVNR